MNAGLSDADWSSFVTTSDLAVSFADPRQKDLPLTFVNDAFCRLTGYERAECEGRNCRFLQGERTRREAVAHVRQGIEERRFQLTELVNYRRNGELFKNALLIGPILGERGELRRLFGMQWDLGLTMERRRGSPLAGWSYDNQRLELFASLIDRVSRLSAAPGSSASGIAVVERLIALSRPWQYPPERRLPNWTQAHALLEYLLDPYRFLLPRATHVSGDAGIVAADAATPLSLVVHELAMHTMRLARSGAGVASIELHCEAIVGSGEPTLALHWLARCHGDLPLIAPDDGFGIIVDVLEHLSGRFEYHLDGVCLEATATVQNRPWTVSAKEPRTSAVRR